MNRNLLFLINPISGTRNKNRLSDSIITETSKRNIPFQIIPTAMEGKYDFLKEKVALEKITDVIICGGDGSINHVASALIGIDVNIGIIPMGSGNGLAFAAKIPFNINKALEIIFNGKAKDIDAFYVNKNFGCMLCGLGFDAQVAHAFFNQKKRGLFTYINISMRHFFSSKYYAFNIMVNNNSFSTDAFFISIANSNQFGNYVTIAPRASLNDGLLDVVIVKKRNKIQTIFSLLKQISLGKIQTCPKVFEKDKGVYYFQTNHIIIQNPALAPLHIDGEPAETNSNIEIKVLPNAFKLIQPC
jgi:YegS/Rv2252/BmrU family lipid kinase